MKGSKHFFDWKVTGGFQLLGCVERIGPNYVRCLVKQLTENGFLHAGRIRLAASV